MIGARYDFYGMEYIIFQCVRGLVRQSSTVLLRIPILHIIGQFLFFVISEITMFYLGEPVRIKLSAYMLHIRSLISELDMFERIFTCRERERAWRDVA
jgi:hypothetical protein